MNGALMAGGRCGFHTLSARRYDEGSCFKVGVEHEVVEGYPRNLGKTVALCVEEVDLT